MKLPTEPVIELPGGFLWKQHDVQDKAWQAHLLKHPLGVDALRRKKALPWNHEGWDRVDPPAITEATRAALAADVSALVHEGKRCGVKELRGGRSQQEKLECYECDPNLMSPCRARISKEPLSERYAEETLRVVRTVVDGVRWQRGQLQRRLMSLLGKPEAWAGLVVMSVGRTDADVPVVRISAAGGVRVELRIQEAASAVRWRTTYRVPVSSLPSQFNHLTDAPAVDRRFALSEDCVVARDWVNRHGT